MRLWLEVTSQSICPKHIDSVKYVKMSVIFYNHSLSVNVHRAEVTARTTRLEQTMVFPSVPPLKGTSQPMDVKNRCSQWRCPVRTLVFLLCPSDSCCGEASVHANARVCDTKKFHYLPSRVCCDSEKEREGGGDHHTMLSWGQQGGSAMSQNGSRKENCHSSNPPMSSVYSTHTLILRARPDPFFSFTVQLASTSVVLCRDLAPSCFR